MVAGECKDIGLFPDGIHIFCRPAKEDLLSQTVLFYFGSQRSDIGLIIGVSPEFHLPVRMVFGEPREGFDQEMLSLGAAGEAADAGDGVLVFLYEMICRNVRRVHRIRYRDEMVIVQVFFRFGNKRREQHLNGSAFF